MINNPPKKTKGPAKKSAWQHKAWEGRFTETTDPDVERFTSSFLIDRRLYPYDILGSMAHVAALADRGLLTAKEAQTLARGLQGICIEMAKEDQTGRWHNHVGDEDVHMHIERRLIETVGDVGGKLHTGRSRNDQVALDLRLYLKQEISDLLDQIKAVQKALVAQAKRHLDVILPGYTHMQRAQPILLAHHMLAYYEMLARDHGRLKDGLVRLDQMPLGSGALAGNGFGLDRHRLAKRLGFSKPTANSLDAVSDRDFVIEFLSAASVLMMHLSRLSEEWILWASSEWQWIELPDAFCTGSSMMPQKKNPDVLELIRGKAGRTYGALLTLLVVIKGLPLSYNRDLQEDKGPLFDTVDTLKDVLILLAQWIPKVRFNKDRMRAAAADDLLLATELADYLILKGMPFRQAHHVVGRIVKKRIDTKKPLCEWTEQAFQEFSTLFEKDVMTRLSPEAAVANRGGIGGTSVASVRAAIAAIQKSFKK